MNAPTLRVSRKAEVWRDRYRKYRVVLDGLVVAKLKRGEHFERSMPNGQHMLQIRINWCASPAVWFTSRAGEVVEFECGPSGTMLDSAKATVVRTDSYISLTRVESDPEPA